MTGGARSAAHPRNGRCGAAGPRRSSRRSCGCRSRSAPAQPPPSVRRAAPLLHNAPGPGSAPRGSSARRKCGAVLIGFLPEPCRAVPCHHGRAAPGRFLVQVTAERSGAGTGRAAPGRDCEGKVVDESAGRPFLFCAPVRNGVPPEHSPHLRPYLGFPFPEDLFLFAVCAPYPSTP